MLWQILISEINIHSQLLWLLLWQGSLIKLLLSLLLGTHLTVFWYSVVQEAEILKHFCCHCWTVSFSWSFSAPPVSQPVLIPAQVCKEMCGSYFQESKPLLFAGVLFLKNPTISEIPVRIVKTIWTKWVWRAKDTSYPVICKLMINKRQTFCVAVFQMALPESCHCGQMIQSAWWKGWQKTSLLFLPIPVK